MVLKNLEIQLVLRSATFVAKEQQKQKREKLNK